MKKYHIEHGLCPRTDSAKAVGIESSALDALMLKDKVCIQYEKKEASNNMRDLRHRESGKVSKIEDPSMSRRRGEKKRQIPRFHTIQGTSWSFPQLHPSQQFARVNSNRLHEHEIQANRGPLSLTNNVHARNR